MQNSNLIFILIGLLSLLDLWIVYQAFTADMFPWSLFILIVLLSSIVFWLVYLFIYRSNRDADKQSRASRLILHLFIGSLVGIAGVMIYDYYIQPAMKWEMYLGFAVPTAVLGVITIVLRPRNDTLTKG